MHRISLCSIEEICRGSSKLAGRPSKASTSTKRIGVMFWLRIFLGFRVEVSSPRLPIARGVGLKKLVFGRNGQKMRAYVWCMHLLSSSLLSESEETFPISFSTGNGTLIPAF